MKRTRILLTARPDGLPQPSDFAICQDDMPEPGPGEVLIAHSWIGLQPAARIRMSAAASYAEPTPLGTPPYAQTVGHIIASRHPDWAEGTLVSHDGGWQSHSISDGSTLLRLQGEVPTQSLWLGMLGLSGMTAYVGLTEIARLQAGERIVISAATGAVGSLAGQIARDMGAQVIGIAGGPQKTALARDAFGYHACVDHRAADFAAQLAAATPDGIDVNFENVGGVVRDAVLNRMNNFGRIALCGLVSEYNAIGQMGGPAWHQILVRRLTLRGFLLRDYPHLRQAFLDYALPRLASGALQYREDITEGLENTPAAFARLLTGAAMGKSLVRL